MKLIKSIKFDNYYDHDFDDEFGMFDTFEMADSEREFLEDYEKFKSYSEYILHIDYHGVTTKYTSDKFKELDAKLEDCDFEGVELQFFGKKSIPTWEDLDHHCEDCPCD